jgi:hypothetical protein
MLWAAYVQAACDKLCVLMMMQGADAGSRASSSSAAAAERQDRTCNGVWSAAGDGQQRRLSKQAVTGRCVGECVAACAASEGGGTLMMFGLC